MEADSVRAASSWVYPCGMELMPVESFRLSSAETFSMILLLLQEGLLAQVLCSRASQSWFISTSEQLSSLTTMHRSCSVV